MKKKEITIYDIAAQLKVSTATVSRALRDDPAVNIKTKKKVLDLAEQHGYQVNHFARNLRKQRTNTIGVIIPRLNSHFMATVISGVERIANAAGFNLIISQSSESPVREQSNARTMFDNRVDGLLVSLTCNTQNLDHFAPFAKKEIPVLFFDRALAEGKFMSISINNRKAGYDATRHLLERGCRRVVHITMSSTQSVYRERFLGYAEALSEAGLPVDMGLVHVTDLSMESGVEAARHILSLSPRPDGVFVANDTCAAGCVVSLKREGVRVPEDIAVAGFNDDLICRIVEPNLTTIHYPGHEMGEVAARTLIDLINGNQGMLLTQQIQLRSDLMVRESTAR